MRFQREYLLSIFDKKALFYKKKVAETKLLHIHFPYTSPRLRQAWNKRDTNLLTFTLHNSAVGSALFIGILRQNFPGGLVKLSLTYSTEILIF